MKVGGARGGGSAVEQTLASVEFNFDGGGRAEEWWWLAAVGRRQWLAWVLVLLPLSLPCFFLWSFFSWALMADLVGEEGDSVVVMMNMDITGCNGGI